MIEREFIKERTKHLKVKEYIDATIGSMAGIGQITIEKTPLGEKILVRAVRPGIIIGRGGKMIQELTVTLRNKFKLDNPQIEVAELENPNLSAAVMSKKIASDLERFGSSRFKAIGYRTLMQIMKAGALGAEIMISGRGVPGARAHSWRFPAGYMMKSGQIALEQIDHVKIGANLRTGTVGVQVRIMHPDILLPDRIKIIENVHIPEEVQKEIDALEAEEKKTRKIQSKRKRPIKSSDEGVIADAGLNSEIGKNEDAVVTETQKGKPKPRKSKKKSDTSIETTDAISQGEIKEKPSGKITQEANDEEIIQSD